MTRPAFGGNTIATIACPDNQTTDGNSSSWCYAEDQIRSTGAKAEVIELQSWIYSRTTNTLKFMDIVKSVADTVDIMDAKILVSGGRGVGSRRTSRCLKDLSRSSRWRSMLFTCCC